MPTEALNSPVWSTIISLVPFLLLGLVFWFMIIRPQKKREKETKAMLDSIKVGDKITTIGGIFGRVAQLRDDVITIEVGAERTQMLIARWAVRNVVGGEVANETAPEASTK
nr:preprotein translocase subunit YajC [Maliibacterium massiliense]